MPFGFRRQLRRSCATSPTARVLKTIEQAEQAGWLKARPASNANLVSLLTVELHLGESEAIALALEMKADRLLIDERDGRMLARQLELRLTGVLGVLPSMQAKDVSGDARWRIETRARAARSPVRRTTCL